jgi:hypothetical protein
MCELTDANWHMRRLGLPQQVVIPFDRLLRDLP